MTAVTDEDQTDHTQDAVSEDEDGGPAEDEAVKTGDAVDLAEDEPEEPHDEHAREEDRTDDSADSSDAWDDGLIARRVTDAAAAEPVAVVETRGSGAQIAAPLAYDGPLR